MRHEHLRPPTWPADIPPARLAARIASTPPDSARLALVGLPDDTGVTLNLGRPGAALGPTAFREALARYGSPFDARLNLTLNTPITDLGDITPATPDDHAGDPVAALHETHRRTTEVLLEVHRAGLIPVCIGGGHDLTFPTVRALAQHLNAPVGGVNVDPHLDVRDTPGSGMPYRALIESGHLDPKRFVEYATARFVNAREHLAYLAERGATTVTLDRVHDGHWPVRAALGMAAPDPDSTAFLSIDLDVLDASIAPGVSALNPMGLDLRTVCEFAERAGANPRIRHFDIMELSPPHDVDLRTARVAALIFLHFVAGFAQRETP